MINNCTVKCGRPSKGDEQLSRDRVLDAATQLFLDNGYGNLSLETIARDAHVSLRTIYSQFGGKDGLFGALIRRCSDQWIQSLEASQPLEVALACFGSRFLYQVTRSEAVRIRAILLGESRRFPNLATQFYEQGPKRTLDYLAEFFVNHQQSGEIKDLDPHFLADQFISCLRGEYYQKLQLGLIASPDEDEINRWVQQVTSLFLYGCLTNPEQSRHSK